MKERFEGQDGKRLLIEALVQQQLVEHDESLAEYLVANGDLISFEPNSAIVSQGDSDNDVYFLITGEANVIVNERFVGTRAGGTCIGEMAAIDPSSARSATVQAKSPVVALRLSESSFREAIDAHPRAYRSLAQILAYRLKQRSRFHQPPNPQPVLFIGCSTEALDAANALQLGLKYEPFATFIWTDGVFGATRTAMQSLEQFADSADFAAFVISPDDVVIGRNEESPAPRDNVIFELGLFMGRLNAKRVFLIKEQHADVKIPSDLLGITPVTYVLQPSGTLAAAMGPVCSELRNIISELGVR